MQLAQRFRVSHPPAQVWAYLGDVRAVARCLPGAEILEIGEDGSIEGRMNVRFGPMSAAFTGEGTVTRDDGTLSGSISGRGLDRQSRSQCRGEVGYRLSETDDGSTEIAVEIDYTLTGTLAQFSRGGLINDLAQRLTAEFSQALEQALAANAKDTVDRDAPAEAPIAAPSEALDAGGLLGAVIWARIKAFCRRLFGRG